MSTPPLAMLWEQADPVVTLHSRFGFADLGALHAWLGTHLEHVWGLEASAYQRVLISDANIIAWVTVGAEAVVVKVCCHAPSFVRLHRIAHILRELDHAGLPVAAPYLTVAGSERAEVSRPRPLSVIVQPSVDGDLLDAADHDEVHGAGAMLARVHEGLRRRPRPVLPPGSERHLPAADLRRRLSSPVPPHAAARAPGAAARLGALLTDLPDLDTEPQLIHGDYRGANVLMRGSRVAAVLDFDDMHADQRIVDLAGALTLLATQFTTWQPATVSAQSALLAGYLGECDLTACEEGWLEATRLWLGLRSIPPGEDPDDWAGAVERLIASAL